MAKEQPKVHLIEDKTIGGVKREYEEVRREVAVGDYVWLVNAECAIKVTEHSVDVANRQILTGDTKALDPTDILHIDGTRYQLAERQAEIGDKVIAIRYAADSTGIKPGMVCEVDFAEHEDGSVGVDGVGFFDIRRNDKYLVLIPVYSCDNCGSRLGEVACSNSKGGSYCSVKCADEEDGSPVDSEPAEPTPDIDIMANLVARVHELEMKLAAKEEFACYVDNRLNKLERITGELVRAKSSVESQLNDAMRNTERLAQELEREKAKVESNTKDIAFLDDRTYEKIGKPTKSAEELLREISKILERDERQ
ncbi:hypothetical protein [Peribacillus frigoritolerans]|uniref:hypothetical protein n=1 Tax=Peribacillus frigoritolerans TaxID=450367 RepID=UPI002E23740B|nr:hypothetical protein [Peribacillus frigoritolerans]MED3845550.1 hypothetical protein [Peribacillus frigoritolerans]